MNLFERYEKLKSHAVRLMEKGQIAAYLETLMELNGLKRQIQMLKTSN